jgi:hypothetical protein
MPMTHQTAEGSLLIVRLQLGERLVDSVSRAGVYSGPPMDPIHSCFAEATQLRNFINSWSRPGSHSLENIRKIANS